MAMPNPPPIYWLPDDVYALIVRGGLREATRLAATCAELRSRVARASPHGWRLSAKNFRFAAWIIERSTLHVGELWLGSTEYDDWFDHDGTLVEAFLRQSIAKFNGLHTVRLPPSFEYSFSLLTTDDEHVLEGYNSLLQWTRVAFTVRPAISVSA